MRSFQLIILIALCFRTQAREIMLKDEPVYAFADMQNYYILTQDSLYASVDGQDWESFKTDSSIGKILTDLKFIVNTNGVGGLLVYKGGGLMYKLSQKKIERIDKSFDHKNQFGSAAFMLDGTVYLYGGYGMWTFKNYFTYFDVNLKEWELLEIESSPNETPKGRTNFVWQLKDNLFYIGMGFGESIDKGNSLATSNVDDFWRFDFNTKRWIKLGNCTVPQKERISNSFSGDNGSLFIISDKVWELNIAENSAKSYPSKIKELLNAKKDLYYNPFKDKYFILLQKHKNLVPFTFSKLDLFGTPISEQILYESHNSSKYQIQIGIILLLTLIATALIAIKMKAKNTVKKQIQHKLPQLKLQLPQNEYELLMKTMKAYPEGVQYAELMDIYGKGLSYESKKKKLQAQIKNCNEVIKKVVNVSDDVLVSITNKDDKRARDLILQS